MEILVIAVLMSLTLVSSSPNKDERDNELQCLLLLAGNQKPVDNEMDYSTKLELCSSQDGLGNLDESHRPDDPVRIITKGMKEFTENCLLTMSMMEYGLIDGSGIINHAAAQNFIYKAIASRMGDQVPDALVPSMMEEIPKCIVATEKDQFPVLRYHDCILEACKVAMQY